MSAAYYNQYLENQVNNASPEELLVMLYNGAIRFISEAEHAMEARQIGRQGMLIGKVINIINELSATLDHEIGGEIAADLEALYDFMSRELLLANVNDDLGRLIQVRKLLSGLRDTWVKAIEQITAEPVVKEDGAGMNSQADNSFRTASSAY